MVAGLLSLCELGCAIKIDNARNMCLAYLSVLFAFPSYLLTLCL